MRVLEIAAFVTLSGAIHVAAVSLAPSEFGGSAGGDGGTNDISLQAATPTLAAMVETWEEPPEVSTAPALSEPSVTRQAPTAPLPDAQVDQAPAPRMPAPQTDLAQPAIDTRLPAPMVPLAQPAPDTLQMPPDAGQSPAAQANPDVDVSRPSAPTGLQAATAPRLPQVDTAPPARRFAPLQSARPMLRPDRPKAAPQRRTTQSTAQPAQKARGSGQQRSSAQAPKRQAPVAKGPSQAQVAHAKREWGNQITRALRRAHRPPRGTEQGTVRLALAISPSGRIQGVSITESSGNARLDQAALSAVKRARFPRAPRTLTDPVYRFSQRLTVSR